jgi:ubiquinone/menaquinone biosynthesis C-methylase UbiE
MKFYETYILPHVINCVCSLKPIMGQRQKVVPLARGRVLEVGIGTALNLPYYDRSKVDGLWGLEPSAGMRRAAQKNLRRSAIEVQWLPLSAGRIPLAEGAVDTVLLTYTLCTIPDWREALAEMRRVLHPDGRLIFCEHGAAPDAAIRQWQTRLTPLWQAIAGGCHLGRPIPRYLEEAGFRILTLEAAYLPGVPKIAGYNYWGLAAKA